MTKTVIIIGGGIAGVSAAEELRNRDQDCDIFVIERENAPLYSRVLLPHYIKGKIPREKVFLKTDAWYAEKRITYLSGAEATAIDTKNQFVRLHDFRELPYDELIIATGTNPRLIGEHAKGVHYLYTLADADGVKAHINRLKTSDHAVVYGGGFIACEFINALSAAGKLPTVLVKGSGFWSKILLPEGQQYIRDFLHAQNIPLFENVGNIQIYAEQDTLFGVKDSQEKEFPAQFLGIGIGAEPAYELAKDANIATDRGILSEEHLLTSAPHVYTAGDVAQGYDVHAGRKRVHGNWAHAQQEGRKVGKICAKSDAGNVPPSQYSTDLLGMKIAFIGDVELAAAQNVYRSPVETGYQQIFLRDGILVGAVLIGNMTNRIKLTNTLGQKWE